MPKLALVAIGGNSLLRAGERGAIAEQRANAALTARYLVQLIQHGYHLVLTHGNGPQVGAQWLRSEIASAQVSPEPLDVCVADTEGAIGYVLERALADALADARLAIPVATLIAQVVVDERDPAFRHPTKPVGPFYSADESRRRERELGWQMVEDAARGYRRVVPSPEPLEIVELGAIRSLVRDGYLVITAGGGGIPVVRRDGHLVGVEAVIDKDRASALLASLLNIDTFIISTDTEHVYLNYRRPDQRAVARMTASEAQAYLDAGHFPPGSMGPKIAAAIGFLRRGGGEVIISAPEHLLDAALGKTGTRIVPDALKVEKEKLEGVASLEFPQLFEKEQLEGVASSRIAPPHPKAPASLSLFEEGE
jgi:carbamate kinase